MVNGLSLHLAMARFGPSQTHLAPRDPPALEQSAARGDRRALEALLSAHGAAVLGLCRALCGPAQAQDLAQEALSRVVTNIGQFDEGRGSFRTFALAIARNTCRDRQRRQRLEQAAFAHDSEPSLEHARATTATPEEQALQQEHLRGLHQALSSLAEGPRQALLLLYLQGATYEDIATTLGVPMGTVMSWIYRGRRQLKEVLSKETRR